MLTPTVRRLDIGRRVSLSYLGGAVAGALVTGGIAWAVSTFLLWWLPLNVPILGILAMAPVAAMRDRGMITLNLPQRKRLVPRSALLIGPFAGAARFGFELGLGFRTYVTTTAPYFVLVGLLLSRPSGYVVALTAIGFGAGRWLPLWRTSHGAPADSSGPRWSNYAIGAVSVALTLTLI